MQFGECLEKSRFTSEGNITLNGEKISYETICEDNVFVDSEGKPVATIFSYSYIRKDCDTSKRPVMFAYNGGPGSSSLWLHIGIIGPRRLKIEDEINISPVPPYELEDNPLTLLDMCDLVIVDPVGTGLGRLLDEEHKKDFYDGDKDIKSLALFIDNWLTRYKRRNSPVFLAGESYGTGRSALLVGELLGAGAVDPETMGISVSGIMLLGSYFFREVPMESTVINISTMASTYFYHKPVENYTREEFVKEAEKFAVEEYLPAFYKGDFLPLEEKEKIAEKMSFYTGLRKEYLLRSRLTVDMQTYAEKVLEEEGKIVGFYDSRYVWENDYCLENTNVIADDPAMGVYTPGFTSGFALLREELNIDFDRSVRGLSHKVNEEWNRPVKYAPKDALSGAMRRNKKLKVFFACGEFDLATTSGMAKYIASHSGLDMNRIKIGVYPSGHMAYLGNKSAEKLGKDMREFFESCI